MANKLYKFEVGRSSIVYETFIVEADSWEEAEEMLYDGDYGEPVQTEWVDWHGHWEEVERETLCPLIKMLEQKELEEQKAKEAQTQVG